jgi:diguanylate cyclase (GGDEF)-like protein
MKAVIVCVDDEWEILRNLGQQLKRNFGKDYEIELTNSGEEALLLCADLTAEGQDIPLIISDQRMQGMGGDALLIQLHRHYPKALKIMLTGQADADSVGNVVNAAALYRYIRKPWDETDLVLTVTEALRRFHQEQQLASQNESLRQINAKLENSLALLLATLEATADGILVLDNAGRVVIFNRRLNTLWHLPDSISTYSGTSGEGHLLDSILGQLIETDAAEFQTLLTQTQNQKRGCLRLKNGRMIEYHVQPQQLEATMVGRVWSFRDVTQEKQTTALVEHQAFHDALTNLPNRVLFDQHLTAALADVTAATRTMAVMFLDLDRFKQVNDTLGHAVGDLLLQSVVQRLQACLGEGDLMARWGGDEFVLLLPQIQDPVESHLMAQRLIAAMQPPFLLEGHTLEVTTSIGIALYPEDGQEAKMLLQRSDAALYGAKRQGRNTYQCYSTPTHCHLPASSITLLL